MNNTTDSFYNSTEQSNLKLLKKKKKNIIKKKPEEEKLEQKNFVCMNMNNNVDILKQEKVMQSPESASSLLAAFIKKQFNTE